jgi:hypothetical protein
MTTTMAHEMATQRTGRVGRPFTPDEDATLRRLAAEGHTRRQIATQWGGPTGQSVTRAQLIGVAFRPMHRSVATHCRRCTILLSAAPVGEGDLCGWCTNDN